MSADAAPESPPRPRSAAVSEELAWLRSRLAAAPRWAVLLPLILAAALALRLYGLDWDNGNFYHPDERSFLLRAACMHSVLTEAPGWDSCQSPELPPDRPGFPGVWTFFNKDASPLNPHWFPLGSVLIYLLVAVRFLLGLVMNGVGLDDLALAGRAVAALVDTATVALVFLLGRRLFGAATGLLAAALTAFAVVGVQLAHFYRPEPFVLLLAPLAFWWMLNALERNRARDHIALGVVIGATFAVRGSSLPMLVPVALAYAALAWRLRADDEPSSSALPPIAKPAVLAAGAAAVAFFLLQPYAVLDYRQYVGDLAWQVNMVGNAGIVPFTLQYVGAPLTGIYELRQTIVWGLGAPLGVAAWGGLALSVAAAFRRPRVGEWLLLSWVIVFLISIVPLFEVKFLRYAAPILPVLILLGSRWLIAALRFARARGAALGYAAGAVIALILAATAFYALAFVNAYRHDHPAVQASAWMNANAPDGAVILTDNHWDEGFPNLGRFDVSQLPMYERDTPDKARDVAAQVANADFIMAYSNRPWGSIARVPDRYPYSAAYYRALFSGELGYELAQGFARYPSLAGITFIHDPFTRAGVQRPETIPGAATGPLTIDLGYADENVVNYDRPLVLVWRNAERLSAETISALMLAEDAPAPPERALMSDERRALQQSGGTWTDVFDESGPNAWAPWLVWLIAVEIIFLAALPLAARLMRRLPDMGVALAKPLGLLIVAWLVWLGASAGVWTFSRGSVALSVLLLALASGAVLLRDRSLIALAKRRWRRILTIEALFVAAYLAFMLIRAANPDLWHPWRGGEKPMDLAYLTAVVKSSAFPPFDPWYAGGFINYYYFGFVPVAALIRLTGIVPEVAYNLALPLLFALAFTGAFSAGYNLAEALRRRGKLPAPAWSSAAAGAAAALLVTTLANVDGAAQLLQGAWRSLAGEHFGHFDFWRSSRVLSHPGEHASVTEFPFWTFLFGDLHAHLISLPFQTLAVGLAANLVLSARKSLPLIRLLPAIAALGFVVGSFAAINTWDVPVYALLSLAALAIALLVRGGPPEPATVAKGLLALALFWAVLYAAWLPFHLDYEAAASGVTTSQWRTALWRYAAAHALLLFAAVSWLAVEAKRLLLDGAGRRALTAAAVLPVIALAAFLSVDALRQWTTAALLAALIAAALAVGAVRIARRNEAESPPNLLLLSALVLALGVGIGVEFLTVENDIDRMNTVFKLYLNAWVLFGIVGGVGLWSVWASRAISFGTRGGRVWLGALAVLALASAVYPALGTRARLADRFQPSAGVTLDGRAYQQSAVYGDPGNPGAGAPGAEYALRHDAEAIDFIRANVEGSPVFLEGVTPDAYRWYPRVPKYAGLPVVVGWQWHQIQQRGAGGAEPQAVRDRMADVALMYETERPALFMDTARKYGIEYVYLGPAERVYFPGPGLDKFDAMAGSSLERIFTNGEASVYRVLGGE